MYAAGVLPHCAVIQLGGHQPAQKLPNGEQNWTVNMSNLEPLTVLDTSLRSAFIE